MSEAVLTNELVNQAREGLNRLTQQLNTVVVGKPEPIRMALVALLSEGHVLIEDVPGSAKPYSPEPFPSPSTPPSGASSSPPTYSHQIFSDPVSTRLPPANSCSNLARFSQM